MKNIITNAFANFKLINVYLLYIMSSVLGNLTHTHFTLEIIDSHSYYILYSYKLYGSQRLKPAYGPCYRSPSVACLIAIRGHLSKGLSEVTRWRHSDNDLRGDLVERAEFQGRRYLYSQIREHNRSAHVCTRTYIRHNTDINRNG